MLSSIGRMWKPLRQSSALASLSLSSASQCDMQFKAPRRKNGMNRATYLSTNNISVNASIQLRFKSALPLHSNNTTRTPFLLADIGEGIAEVELLQWYVTPGSTISQFDRVCQVQSDKASVEITSRYDGVVKELCAEVGGVVKVGEPLCFMETQSITQNVTLHNVEEKEMFSVPSAASDKEEEESFAVPKTLDTTEVSGLEVTSDKALSSPAVRKLVKEYGIDISTIQGTGPNGRVLKSDILSLIQTNGCTQTYLSTPIKPTTFANSDTRPTVEVEQDEIIPIRGYHRLMVKSMTSSLSIPHMVYNDEINVSSLQSLRSQLKPWAQQKGIKLTLLPFFLKAASMALLQYPVVNSSIDTEKMELIVHKRHDLGVAVDAEKGLVVVVVRGCEMRSVEEIAIELGRLFALASALYWCMGCHTLE